jgi:hypothetical protein
MANRVFGIQDNIGVNVHIYILIYYFKYNKLG